MTNAPITVRRLLSSQSATFTPEWKCLGSNAYSTPIPPEAVKGLGVGHMTNCALDCDSIKPERRITVYPSEGTMLVSATDY